MGAAWVMLSRHHGILQAPDTRHWIASRMRTSGAVLVRPCQMADTRVEGADRVSNGAPCSWTAHAKLDGARTAEAPFSYPEGGQSCQPFEWGSRNAHPAK
jgi:hypothetical protein